MAGRMKRASNCWPAARGSTSRKRLRGRAEASPQSRHRRLIALALCGLTLSTLLRARCQAVPAQAMGSLPQDPDLTRLSLRQSQSAAHRQRWADEQGSRAAYRRDHDRAACRASKASRKTPTAGACSEVLLQRAAAARAVAATCGRSLCSRSRRRLGALTGRRWSQPRTAR